MSKDNELDFYKFQLSFKGNLVENSVDAYDVANTILATSNILSEISEIHYGQKVSKNIKININAFREGSLLTDFLILANDIKDATVPLLPVAGNVYKVGKDILGAYKTYIDVRKILKGKPPKEVKAIDSTSIQLTAHDNAKIIINYNDFRTVQSKTVAKNFSKATQPLSKEDSLVEEINFITEEEGKKSEFTIEKKDSSYFGELDNFQTIEEMKYKGIVSKIDTKALSGYLDISSKRLPFNYNESLPQDKFIILVESLKRKIQIYVIGTVIMDYENNPKGLQINDVQSDIKLF